MVKIRFTKKIQKLLDERDGEKIAKIADGSLWIREKEETVEDIFFDGIALGVEAKGRPIYGFLVLDELNVIFFGTEQEIIARIKKIPALPPERRVRPCRICGKPLKPNGGCP